MIIPIILLISEISAVAILLERGEIQFLQILLFSQAWIFIVALPFLFRSETRSGILRGKAFPAIIFVLCVGALSGSWFHVQDFQASNYADAGKNLFTQFNDLFFVFGAVVAAVTMLASAVLRSDK